MTSSFSTSTFPGTTEVTPFTSLPPVSPSSWAKSATGSESLLPSVTSPSPTSPYYYTTDSSGHTSTIALIQSAVTYETITTVKNGQTWYYELPVTATPTPTPAPGPNKTTTIVLSVVVTIVGLAGLIIVALLILRGRTRRRRQAWRARYPSQWSWDAKYHDAEPDPTPLEPTTSGTQAAEGSSAYAFAPAFSPSHSRFPSSDLPRTEQPEPSLPQAAHNRDRSM
ncbi:hypothetical protein CALVIDRAFT_552074 [Calocera viscosa TUFC12733]|uniref:Mid2 domain-containing protein n=1 Tax=Calocera viscosa (strain TUFC12733) TaxID=1330018 RepID=A0A167SBQ7_CALVF|nr:hypothetical protein CALVIDRAFT_552074 [Calocera viscosa TUFC12733]